MSLANFSDLTAAVANWMARQGDTIISVNAPDMITLCEKRVNFGSDDPDAPYQTKPLRTRDMEEQTMIPVSAVTAIPASGVGGTANVITLAPGTPIAAYALGQTWNFPAVFSCADSGVQVSISGLANRPLLKGSALAALAANDIIVGENVQLYDDGTELVLMPGTGSCPLPANYVAMRSIYLDTNPRRPLIYVSPQQANQGFSRQWPDEPQDYTIEGDAIRLISPPDTSYNLECLFYEAVPPLATSGTNWLMSKVPNIYLYGSLLEAAIFTGDWDSADRYFGFFKSAVNGFQSQDQRDRHSGAVLTIRNDTGNP